MDQMLNQLIQHIQSENRYEFTSALSDLRLVIERFTMNRYEEKEMKDYYNLFGDKRLVDYKMQKDDYFLVKNFLFYALLNFPDRSLLTAKCIKVLFDNSALEAICNSVEFFSTKNDETTYELILAITDVDEFGERYNNKRIMDLFVYISEFGGELSKELVKCDLKFSSDSL